MKSQTLPAHTVGRHCCTCLLFFFLLIPGPASSQGTFWTITSDYSGTEICGGEVEISVCFSGNESFIGNATISFTQGVFVVTDPGDFTQVNSNTFTAQVDAPFDYPFCIHLRGKRANPANPVSITGVLNGLIGSQSYLNSQITTLPVFISIDGGNGTPLANFYPPLGNTLLQPSQAVFHAQFVRLAGKIIITENYNFGTNSEITMEPDASILINPGVTFRLSPRTVVTACSEPWDKIEVSAAATLQTSGSLSGTCKIVGGTEAIQIHPGGIVRAFGTEFLDNGTAIKALGNNGVTSTTDLSVVACDFKDTHKYFPITTGIDVTDLPFTELPFILAFVTVYFNSFDGLTTGILANHSDLLIERPIFTNVYNSIASFNNSIIEFIGNGGGCSHPTVSMGNTAVYSVESDLSVHDVSCNKMNKGIDHYPLFANETSINDNCLTAAASCINIGSGTNSTGSIYDNRLFSSGGLSFYPGNAAIELNDISGLASTNDWLVTTNEIVSEGAAAIYGVNFENAQIYNNHSIVNSSGGPAIRLDGGYQNKVQCNPVIEGATGVLFNGTSQSRIDCNSITGATGIQILGNCEKSDLRGNDLNGDYADLLYGDPNAAYALTGDQKYHRNRFLGNQGSGFNAINYEPAPDIALESQFLISVEGNEPCPTDDKLMPLFSSSASTWFFDDPFEYNPCSFVCPNPCVIVPGISGEGGGEGIGGQEGDGRKLDRVIREGALNVGPYTGGVRWTTQKRLYRRLMESGDIPRDFAVFADEKRRGSIGAFYSIDARLNNLLRWNDPENNRISELRSQRRAQMIALKQIRPVTERNGEFVTDPPLYGQYKEVIDEIRRIDAAIDGAKTRKFQEIKAALPALIAENNRISAVEIYEANQQAVNSLMLKRLAEGVYKWNETDKNTLLGIATQCPLSGGDAVFQARALLGGTEGLPQWDDVAACPSGKERSFSEKQDPDTRNISIFPNPAMDWINVYIGNDGQELADQPVVVELSGLDGRVLVSQRFTDHQPLMHIALPALPAGLYMLRVARSLELSKPFKIHIVRP